jgi:hypothetical protein
MGGATEPAPPVSSQNPLAEPGTLGKEYVRGYVYTNIESAFSLLKRGIVGTWHRVSAEHLAAYLDEMTWRFNNRKNPFLFRDTMLRQLGSDTLEYKELTQGKAQAA